MGGALVTASLGPVTIRRCNGELKGFPKMEDLITIISEEVGPCDSSSRMYIRGRNPAITETILAPNNFPYLGKCWQGPAQRNVKLVIKQSVVCGIPNARILLLGAAVTHKARTMIDLPFDLMHKTQKGGFNVYHLDSAPKPYQNF